MKRVRRNMYGRKYTTFGYYFQLVLNLLTVLSFFLLLCFTGSCERGGMSTAEYIRVAIPCLAVFGVSIVVYNKVFEGR